MNKSAQPPRSNHQSFTARLLCFVILLMPFALVGAVGPGIAESSAQEELFSDVGVTKVGPDQATPDTNLTYTITVINGGPDAADGATLSDTLPAGTTFVSLSQPSGWTCSTPAVGASGTVSCTNPSLAVTSADGETFTLVVHVDTEPPGTFITNTATVSSTTDSNEENNSSTTSALLMGSSADVGVTKLASSNLVVADTDITYTITVSNGVGPADNATLTDTLPGTMTFVLLSAPAGWTCSTPAVGAGGTISCSKSSLQVTSGEVFNLVGHVPSSTPAGTEFSNTATVSSNTPDVNSENDSATASTTVADCLAFSTVTTNADSGAGSLRQAILESCAGGFIAFDMTQVTSPITLTSGDLIVAKDLTIQGPGADVLTVRRSAAGGTPQFRIFTINSGTVSISGLTITNGHSADGAPGNPGGNGGGMLNAGTLTLTNITISGNNTGVGGSAASGGFGAGVYNSGTLSLVNSTISGNTTGAGGSGSSGGDGGGIYNQGTTSTLTLTNSTVSNNQTGGSGTAAGAGGGIFNGGTLTLTNSTVSGNQTASGGNGNGGGVSNAGTTNLQNTIVGNNIAGLSGIGPDLFGAFNSQDYNLIGNTSGATFTGTTTHNIVDQSVNLGPLANNGGPTQTMLPLLGSPAINAGDVASLPTDTFDLDGDSNTDEPLPFDQRGFARVVGPNFDIGAVETNYVVSATAGTPQSTAVNTAFGTALQATVTESGRIQGGIPVTFTAPASGASGRFPGGVITAIVTTNSSGVATAPTFTANEIGGSYDVVASIGTGFPTATFALTNTKIDQTITFGALANKTFGDPDFTVSAMASSGLTVSFAASGQCTVSGNTVHINGAGSCTITASQPGNSTYNAAPDVPQSFNIAKAATTTIVSSSKNPSAAGQTVTFTATVSSTAGTPTGTVQFNDGGTTIAIVALNGSGQASVSTSSLSIGTHTITADYSGDGNFNVSTGTLSGGQVVVATLIEFKLESFNTTESSGATTITVQRVGDVSQTMTIDYATSDDSDPATAVPCATVTGIALSRCDFTTAIGRLTFGPTEAEKTFTVLISQDSYVEGSETLTLTLSNPGGGGTLATPPTATLTIADDLIEPPTNVIDDVDNFVRQHYHDFLNREADAPGLDFWTNQILSCGSNAQCIEVKRINVSAAFFVSIEFQTTGGTAYRTNKVAFNALPAYTRFEADAQALGRNYVFGQPGAEAILEANKQAYFNEFVTRPEFISTFGSLTNGEYVDALIANTGVAFTQAERDLLVNGLNGGTETRATVLRQIAEKPSFGEAEFTRSFVLMEYFGYLRRNPDTTGFNFWLNKLNQFNGNFIEAEMVKAFITSAEYRQRFGP